MFKVGRNSLINRTSATFLLNVLFLKSLLLCATYRIAKHLAKLLSPLSTSEYTVKSTKDLIEKLKTVKVPKGNQMVSFDAKALFTNVPLECTIDLVLKRIYENHEISTSITRNEMREILLLCTKNVHFTFRDVDYLQTDGVAMGSSLGPVLAGILMVDLERSLVPLITAELSFGNDMWMTPSLL